MKKHMNTLFITTQGAYLAKDGECISVKAEGETKAKVPVHTLDGVVCFGQVSLSPACMAHMTELGKSISFLTENGRFQARVLGPAHGNVVLRREQYRLADRMSSRTALAADMLTGKLANCRTVLRRAVRDHKKDLDHEALGKLADRYTKQLQSLHLVKDIEELRGLEGDAAHEYFGVFDQFIRSKSEAFRFSGRNRRPPLDNVNAMLSFVYTLLAHDVRSALESVGLDPQVGFLHADRSGRPGLALDMMEEFRPYLADRLVLSLINTGMVKPAGFKQSAVGGVRMSDKTRKDILIAWQERKRDVVEHPFLKEKMTVGFLFHIQAMLLARRIRGDLDAYPPFIMH